MGAMSFYDEALTNSSPRRSINSDKRKDRRLQCGSYGLLQRPLRSSVKRKHGMDGIAPAVFRDDFRAHHQHVTSLPPRISLYGGMAPWCNFAAARGAAVNKPAKRRYPGIGTLGHGGTRPASERSGTAWGQSAKRRQADGFPAHHAQRLAGITIQACIRLRAAALGYRFRSCRAWRSKSRSTVLK